jgi:hypothetical protein
MWAKSSRDRAGTSPAIARGGARVFGVPISPRRGAGHRARAGGLRARAALTDVEDAHKLGGPIGVGALVARRDARLVPSATAAGRSAAALGTLDTPAIRGFAEAVVASVAQLEEESARLTHLRDDLVGRAIDLGLGVRVTATGRGRPPPTAARQRACSSMAATVTRCFQI